MSVLEMYNDFREKFPEITRKADEEHIKFWDEIDPAFAYSWFESLAKVINRAMSQEELAKHYKAIFEYFRTSYLMGDDKVKKCIDVSFVENLFWGVDSEKARSYWAVFPDLLKKLYLNFHSKPPAK